MGVSDDRFRRMMAEQNKRYLLLESDYNELKEQYDQLKEMYGLRERLYLEYKSMFDMAMSALDGITHADGTDMKGDGSNG